MKAAWVVARLREPSTWRGLVWLLTACGVTLRPEIWEQITAVGMAIAGLIGVLTREPENISLPPIDLVGKSAPGGADADSGVGPGGDHPAADRVRQPLRPLRNTEEASVAGGSHPGWTDQ